jgi:hypothetical protein
MVTQVLRIPDISLAWGEWHNWSDIEIDGRSRSGVSIPDKKQGVYEARLSGEEERLTIGATSNLRFRVRECLVKGKGPHSAGKRIREMEFIEQIEIRWAQTDHPRCAEVAPAIRTGVISGVLL